jgi:two-component SAPR family response regulator
MEDKKRAKTLAKIEKLELKLNKFKELIKIYKQAYLDDDGVIDSKEQKRLDKFTKKIAKITAKIDKTKEKLGGGDTVIRKPKGKKGEREDVAKKIADLRTELEDLMIVYGLS